MAFWESDAMDAAAVVRDARNCSKFTTFAALSDILLHLLDVAAFIGLIKFRLIVIFSNITDF